ncbi:MAG TPA: hypothetical protein VGR07_11350, partial [Thermoanaerobaculia bacterium]|nr:hypothetical protein [Thermoanaerobaculia bacterium]
MRKPALLILAGLLALPLLAHASTADAVDTAASQQVPSLKDVLARVCPLVVQGAADPGSCLASAVKRRVIFGNVAEYSLEIRTGAGEHDKIGLHRVVKESAPFVAVRASQAILLAHGDAWGFDAAFLANLTTPGLSPEHAFPVFLAERGIDVWGIDFGWALVPTGTTDFAFFKSWGIGRDARDLGIALALARVARFFEGDGLTKIDLLGWSRGAQVGYAYVDAETLVPRLERQVKAFIPVDIFVKTNDPALKQAACTRAAAERALLDAGTYQNTTGTLFATLGTLALTAPAAPSPIVPGLTNRQAALLAGSATYALLPPGQVFVPFYHFAGGTFDAQGLPTGLTFTPQDAWFHFEAGASPYEPEQLLADGDALACDQQDVPWDD